MHFVVSKVDVEGRVWVRHERDDQDHCITSGQGVFERHSVVITPLSAITDEDARAIGYEDYSTALNYKSYTDFFEDQRIEDIDYLRSRGYALPWMNYSVEQLIELGWIKIRE